MNKSAVVHARIDSSVKKEAESVFNRLGLTPTEAVRLFYTQVSLSQGIPFSLHIPNEATAKVMCPEKTGHEILLERGSTNEKATLHCRV